MTLEAYIEALQTKRIAVVGVGVSNLPLLRLLLRTQRLLKQQLRKLQLLKLQLKHNQSRRKKKVLKATCFQDFLLAYPQTPSLDGGAERG